MADNIKPCPFCGSDDTEVVDMPPYWWIACRKCDAGGPMKGRKAPAIAAWNQRKEELDTARKLLKKVADGDGEVCGEMLDEIRDYIYKQKE